VNDVYERFHNLPAVLQVMCWASVSILTMLTIMRVHRWLKRYSDWYYWGPARHLYLAQCWVRRTLLDQIGCDLCCQYHHKDLRECPECGFDIIGYLRAETRIWFEEFILQHHKTSVERERWCSMNQARCADLADLFDLSIGQVNSAITDGRTLRAPDESQDARLLGDYYRGAEELKFDWAPESDAE